MQFFRPTSAVAHTAQHHTQHLHTSPEDWKGSWFPTSTSVYTRRCNFLS